MSKPTATITVGYVDMASYDKPDELFYGGDKVATLFSRQIKKYSWYTQLFAPDKNSGTNEAPSFSFSKTGDFALMSWVETTTPALTVKSANNGQLKWRIAYTIWKQGALKFNDLTAQSYETVGLDFVTQYRNRADKWALYQKFIGNTAALQNFGASLPATTIKLPTPFYYGRDSSYALALCCASLNDIKEEFVVETDLSKLVRVQKNVAVDVVNDPADWRDQTAASVDFSSILDVAGGKPFELGETRHWTKYVLVTDDEREAHQDEVRDVIIEQFQKANGKKEAVGEQRLEFHFVMPVKALFFGFANKTSEDYNNRSNYSDTRTTGVSPSDPVASATLTYENQDRFANIPGHHFDMETWQHGARAISEVGYHAIFYNQNINDLDMTGSSNFSNLVTSLALEAAEASGENNTYSLCVRAISAHRGRCRSSTFGFPAF
jgi:flagellar hook-associated protein FlgK